MSTAPRPHTKPSTISPPNGSRLQPSGFTGTTSVWPIRRSDRRVGVGALDAGDEARAARLRLEALEVEPAARRGTPRAGRRCAPRSPDSTVPSLTHCVADQLLEEVGDLGGGVVRTARHGRPYRHSTSGVPTRRGRAGSSANASSMPPASVSRSGAAAPSPTMPKYSSPQYDITATLIVRFRESGDERVHLEHLGAEAVERHLRARHVGDHEVGEGCPCAARAASPSSVGAAYSVSPMSAAAPTACSRSFRSAVLACTASSRTSRRARRPRGHEHRRDPVAELRALAVVAHRHRAEALHGRSGELTARVEQARSAPPTPASTTSLTVHPNALLTDLTVRARPRTVSIRRPRPDGPLIECVARSGLAVHQRADRPRRAQRRGRRRSRGAATPRRASPASSTGCRSRSHIASITSRAGSGAGSGFQSGGSITGVPGRSRRARWRCRCRRCRR